MKKILFNIEVLLLAAAFPVYFYAEVNHNSTGTATEQVNKHSNGKARLYVILKMPAAPEYQVQYVND